MIDRGMLVICAALAFVLTFVSPKSTAVEVLYTKELTEYCSHSKPANVSGDPVALKKELEHVISDMKSRNILEKSLPTRYALNSVLRRDFTFDTDKS